MQLAPFLLLVFGVLIFHEHFSRLQSFGFVALVVGLVLFFNRRLPELLSPAESWSFGILLLVFSAISWAIYGVGQKQLLRHFDSAQILVLVYAGATLFLLPTAHPGMLLHLHREAFLAVMFGIVNTVVAYGAFGMALEVWDVSRVGSVAASAPLFTVVGSLIGARAAFAWVTPDALSAVSMVGALCVVAGSMVSALGSRREKSSTRTS